MTTCPKVQLRLQIINHIYYEGKAFFTKFSFSLGCFFYINRFMPDRLKKQRFVFLAMAMLLIFSFPLITLGSKELSVSGIPVLYIYLAVCWVICIILLYRAAEGKGSKNSDRHE